MTRILYCIVLFSACVAALSGQSLTRAGANGGYWVGAWEAADYAPLSFVPVLPDPPVADKTIRMIIRSAIGGPRLRVRFSNEFGEKPLRIGAAHIAIAAKGSSVQPNTDRVLTFDGHTTVTIPPGAPLLSDPIELPVAALSEVAISIYFPSETSLSTVHRGAQRDSYVAGPGDMTAATDLSNSDVKKAWYFLSGLEVLTDRASTVVAFGDSITEGSNNEPLAYADYPDQLAERLAGSPTHSPVAIVNGGIAGNRILHDGAGISALARFDKDVLSLPGVSSIIVLEGINDIGFPRARLNELKIPNPPPNRFVSEKVSAEEIAQGLQQVISRAHEHGMRVFGATLMPFEGTIAYDSEGEALRQSVNQWIRTAKKFDGVFDFDALVRDPDRPTHLRKAYDSGDHIHPNAAGYKAMADSISLAKLAPGP